MSSENPTENTAETQQAQPVPASDVPPATTEEAEPAEEIVDVNLACLREVDVEIPADIVSKEFESATQRYSSYPVPGFRRGKVPASVIRKRFANEIRQTVVESLLPRYYEHAVTKQGFSPICPPEFHSLVMEPGQPAQFKAAFEIMPDIQLGNYRDLKLEVPEVTVTDEDVEGALKQLQEERASYDPVDEDRPAQDQDFVQVALQTVAKETPAPAPEGENPQSQAADPNASKAQENQPVQVNEVFVEVGGAHTLPEFSDHLRGAKPGEERTFDVTYPADHDDPRLAGKTLSYTAKVNALKKKSMPELTDDFAKELSPQIETLDKLKEDLRKRILAERQYQVAQHARQTLLNQLTESHDFPVPETLLQRHIDYRLERFLRNLEAQGVSRETMKRLDFQRIRRDQRPVATKEVKADLLLDKIAEAEGLQATDEELTQEIHQLAEQMKQTPESLQQRLAEGGGLGRLRFRISSEKALRFLYDQATGNALNGAVQE